MKRTAWVFLAVLLFSAAGLPAAEAVSPRINPTSFWQEAAGWPDTLDPGQIIVSSLLASGVNGDELADYTLKLEKLIDDARSLAALAPQDSDGRTASDYARGEALLAFIHDNLLTRYSFHQTKLDVLLDTGENNCVSSSVLYLLLGRIIGLDVSAVETKDHVFCVVKTEEGEVDVETTTVWGFDPGTKKEFADEFNQTGFTYVPPGNYRYRTADTDKELIGLILQNRMARLQRERNHAATVGLAVDRYTFVGNEKSFDEMNSSFKNWASELSSSGNDREAFLFLSAASRNWNLLTENATLLYQLAHNVIVPYINTGRHDEAEIFLSRIEATPGLMTTESMAELARTVGESRLEYDIQHKDYEEAVELVREGREKGYLNESRWRELTIFLNRNHAIEVAQDDGWLTGAEFIETLPSEEQRLSGMMNLAQTFRQNWAVGIHNRFVDLAQARRFDEARRVLEEGLVVEPENRTLLRDLSDLEKIAD